MSAIKNLLAFINKILLTGQKITDNVESVIKNVQDAIELVDTKLTELETTTDNLTNEKIDSLTLSENTLIAKANGITKATITLPASTSSDSGSSITVDSSLSTDSTNPVQNKIVTNALNNKANSSHTHSYNDLTDKPTIPSLEDYYTKSEVDNKLSEAVTGGTVDLSEYATKIDLDNKADKTHSHSYNDLIDKPTIPTVDSSLSSTSTNAIQNKVVTEALDNKIDGISLSGNTLTSIVGGQTKDAIDLSSLAGSGSSSVDLSSYYNDAAVVGSQLKLMNGSNTLKTLDLPTGVSSGSGSLPESEYLVRDLVRDYGAKGDGVKRSIKSVDSSVTLSEVQALRSDATLDDQWDWYCLQRAVNDIAEGKYHKLFIPKAYGGDGSNMYMISKSIRIPQMAMRFIEGNMSVIEQITDNEFIFEFKEEDTWGCTFENLYLRYTNPQRAGKTKSIALAFNPDANKVQGGWYLNTFKNFRIKNAYTCVGAYKVGRTEGSYQIAIWSCTFDTFNIKNCYYKGFDLATGIGQPNIVLNDVRCLQDDNYTNHSYDNKVKGSFIEASATNLVIKGLDLEKWHNRILNIYGGSTLIMENTHIEHHYIDRNGGTVFGEKDGLILISNDGYYDINMFDISDVKSSSGYNVPVVRIEQCKNGGLFFKGLKTQVVEGNKLSPISTDSSAAVECSFMYGDFVLDESKALGLLRFNNKFYSTMEGVTGVSSSSSSSDLPIATTTSLGAIKVGGGLTVKADGTLSVAGMEGESGTDQEEHAPDSGVSSDNYTYLFNVLNEGGKLSDYSVDNPLGVIDASKGAILIESATKSGAKTITNTFSLNSDHAWTLEWATDQTLSPSSTNNGCICADKGDSDGKLVWMKKSENKLLLRASDSVKPSWILSAEHFTAKHNFALVYDGVGNISLYVDGALFGTQPYNFTGAFDVDRLLGGYWSSSTDFNFIGYMYYFRYSNSALTVEQLHVE